MSSDNLKYTMVIEAEESGGEPYFNGYFPDVPGCTAYGRTLEEIRTNAASALSEHLATLRDHGKPIPEPHVRVETIAVSQ